METKVLGKFKRHQPIDIDFTNLSFSVGKKEILKSVSGNFSSGSLSAILGSSGAGKTTLLNILAGHVQSGVSGQVLINGKRRVMQTFHKMSCYLMQEDLLRPLLSVKEAISISAKLKLGKEFSSNDKERAVRDVMNLMGLEKCSNTRVENLSGGQKKRLSIALEMVNNPPVVFLDEPTTGLDNVVAKKFIKFLKALASHGRTIVCTIHQPSDLMFQLFDQAYFLSDGYCVYNGEADGIVPFLSSINLPCPSTYSPCDYIIELLHFNSENTQKLKNAIENGQNEIKRFKRKKYAEIIEFNMEEENSLNEFPVSFWEQSFILSCRTFTQIRRDSKFLTLLFLPHVVIGIMVGLVFGGVGKDGEKLIENVYFLLTMAMHFLFTNMMPHLMSFPFEVKLLQREYSNRWYSLKAYYTALSVTTFPIAVIPTVMYALIVYVMTDQPLEVNRFFGFILISILTAITAQAFGHAIGSLLSPMLGACIGSAFIAPLVLLAIYGIEGVDTMYPVLKYLRSISFVRHSFAGYATGILRGRGLLDCEVIFCYFRDPEIVLGMFGMESQQYYMAVAYLTFYFLIHKICTYIFLRFRLSPSTDFFLTQYITYFENKLSAR